MAELIKKIGENNVLVVPVKTVETTAKESVEVYDYDKQVSYGADKIKQDEALADTQLAFWANKTKTDAYILSQTAKYQALKDRVTAVKAEMAKTLGAE